MRSPLTLIAAGADLAEHLCAPLIDSGTGS